MELKAERTVTQPPSGTNFPPLWREACPPANNRTTYRKAEMELEDKSS